MLNQRSVLTKEKEEDQSDSDGAVEIKAQDLQPFEEPGVQHISPEPPTSSVNPSVTTKAVEETPEQIEAEMRAAIFRDGLQLHVTSPGKQAVRTASGMPAELEALYDVGSRPIGKGKFSVVYKGVRKSDKLVVAVKQIAFFEIGDARTREKRLKEIGLVQNLKHQHIIRYIDGFFESKQLCLIFEFAEAGDLKRQIKKAREKEARFDERVIWKYFSQVAEAVQHLHHRRILHRDLKPANVFLTLQGTVKVGDLGLSRLLSENTLEAHSKVGTPLYMSPEVLKGRGYERSSDVWSLGCILYELALLKSPFKEDGLNLYELFRRITDPNFQYPPISDIYSFELRDLVNGMLMRDPTARPDIDEVVSRANAMRDSTAQAAREAAGKIAAAAATTTSSQGVTSDASRSVIDVKSSNSSNISSSSNNNNNNNNLLQPHLSNPVAGFSSLSIKTEHHAVLGKQIAPPVSPIIPLPSITPIQLEQLAPPPPLLVSGPTFAADNVGVAGAAISLQLVDLAGLSPFAASELLCDRLIVLKYTERSSRHFFVPIPYRTCFAYPSTTLKSGSSSPFTLFVAVAQFLLSGLRRGIPQALFTSFTNGMASPLSIVTALLDVSSSMTGASQALSGITSAGLLPGHGPNVLRFLIWLTDLSIEPVARTSGFSAFHNAQWRGDASEIPSNDDVEEILEQDINDDEKNGLIVAARGGDDIKVREEIEDYDDNVLFKEVPKRSLIVDDKRANERKSGSSSPERKNEVADIEAVEGGVVFDNIVDAAVWRAEVERVSPRLGTTNGRVFTVEGHTLAAPRKDEWRFHLDQAFESTKNVALTMPAVQDSLIRNSDELTSLREMIDQRERRINSNGIIASLTSELNVDSTRKSELAGYVREAQLRVTKLSDELDGIGVALEDVKGELEEKGSSLSDTSPLIRARAALLDLRAESKLLDRSIGVVQNAVLQHRVEHKKREAHVEEFT
jgi:serine/threonine protein kinase